MRMHWRLSGLLLLVAALFTAATPLLTIPAAAAPADAPATFAAPASASALRPVAARPDWHTLPLVDARTGQTFTLADLDGKTVYVEPMATWCTNCRGQMGLIRDQVLAQLDPERTVLVGLSVETDLPPEKLAAYVDAQGFSWTFAVMTPELLQALSSQFGLTVANPPAIPHFVIGPDGTTSDLSTGFHTADRLLAELTAAGSLSQ
jgi:cytochrome oxidase Cu insertion factor (SCO1/SenC/PrrC family)